MSRCKRKIVPAAHEIAATRAVSLVSTEAPTSPWQNRTIYIRRVYNWGIWALLAVLLFAQFFGVIWSSVTSDVRSLYGRPPALGKYAISGQNDEPYSDRGVACVKMGHYFRPIQLSQLLKQRSTEESSSSSSRWTTNGVDGYRVVARDSFVMDAASYSHYVRQCSTLSATLENVFTACTALGYNVTQDVLRIVNGVDSEVVVVLQSSLPVLIMPYWDYGSLSRYIVPGQDGSACIFRGGGTLTSEIESSSTLFYGASREVRETVTQRWLEYPGGDWRNGWYEDPVVNMRWYSDVISSVPNGEYGIDQRQFDLFANATEADCSKPPYGCRPTGSTWRWNEDLRMDTFSRSYHSITISNGSRFGLFLFDGLSAQEITSRYSIEKLISNASFIVLLARWIVALVALSPADTIGIGALANANSFQLLPLFLLPRLKSSLQGFWTAGCFFEGNQRALAGAWFEIYPAIGEIVFLYFSLLNITAKVLRRRVNDVLFGPTLLLFGLLHYFRLELARWPWLGIGGRVSTIVAASELEAASVVDFFTTDLAFRVNGRVRSIFYAKLIVLAANLVLPLLVGSRSVLSVDENTVEYLRVEKALAIHFDSNAGLGSTKSPYLAGSTTLLRPYELGRAGYIVVGSSSSAGQKCLLMSVDHWMWVLATAPLRRTMQLAIRVVAYDISSEDKHETPDLKQQRERVDITNKCLKIAITPSLSAVSDELLSGVSAWRVSIGACR